MKLHLIIGLSALSLCCSAEETQYSIVATVATRDGCVIKGETDAKMLTGDTLFCSNLQLDPCQIASLSFIQTNGSATAFLTNGDSFAYKVIDETIAIKSALGTLKIPYACLRSLSFEKRRANNFCDDLVFACDFESAAEIPNFNGGAIVPGKHGNALHVPAHTSSAKIELPPGSIGDEGTIEFWGKIDAEAYMTNGGCPRFFEIIDMVSKREISQDWNANNGAGGCGLTFRIDGLPVMASSNYRKSSYESILGDPTRWHHYALVWNAKGLEIDVPFPSRRISNKFPLEEAFAIKAKPQAAVFIDGQCIMTTSSDCWQGTPLHNTTSTLFFPCREDEMPDYSRVGYSIDQFKLWKISKTKFND